jgi:hypothetical protein
VSQDRAQELFARHLTRPYQGVSRIEIFVCCLWIPVVRQGVVCFHSVGLGCSWIFTTIVFNDPCGSTQCDPYIFVEYFRHYRQDPARLPTTEDSLYLSLQQVSQDRAQELFARHLTRPYQGVSRIEFFVCCLWIPVVRQGVVCSHSVGLGCSWIFTTIVFNDPCGSTLFVSMFISLVFSLRRSA